MPDGSLQEAVLSTFGDPALEPMHRRLVDYGLCWIRGGEGASARWDAVKVKGEDDRIVCTEYRDPDPERKPRTWSRPEIEAAGRLHSRIIRLPLLAQSLTIQVFYGESSAADWYGIEPDAKWEILRDLTTWPSRPYGVNPRIRHHAATMQIRAVPIRVDEFLPIMLRGMRILVNSERMLNGS